MKRTLLILAVTMTVAPLKVEVCVGISNVISGEMVAYMNVNDKFGCTVVDTGTGLAAIKFFTVYYPNYDDPPMYQTSNTSLSYSYPTTLYYDSTDSEGNSGRVSWWGDPGGGVHLPLGEYSVNWSGDVGVYVDLDGLRDSTQFPISISFTPDVSKYLEATPNIQSNHTTIANLAQNLVSGSDREPEAVVKIMNWVADNVQYDTNSAIPQDALSIIEDPQHRSRCLGYARVPIALLRSVGISAKLVAGGTTRDTLWIPTASGSVRISWYQGYHAWVEVYYGDEGWIPYDLQRFYHFVPHHRYKQCEGRDTGVGYANYGIFLGYWRYLPGQPQFGKELIAGFSSTVDWKDKDLQYVETLPTPSEFMVCDKIIPLTGIQEEMTDDGGLPKKLSLSQNYPNPFNPETIIEYTLPEGPERVKLAIYNILGQKVKTLVDEEKSAGMHRTRWDGTDDKGNKVASGIYFSRVKIGSFSEAKKMVILK
jgi:transglutaminase-like putative cysteine protease